LDKEKKQNVEHPIILHHKFLMIKNHILIKLMFGVWVLLLMLYW